MNPYGIQVKPKDLASLMELQFPRTLKAMQSFMGSIIYYGQFIDNFAVYAAILYESTNEDLQKSEDEKRIMRAKTALNTEKQSNERIHAETY